MRSHHKAAEIDLDRNDIFICIVNYQNADIELCIKLFSFSPGPKEMFNLVLLLKE